MEVLIGFKYIGEKMKLFEENHDHEYLFGFEESYGCLLGTHARDKDAIVAVMALCEAAAYYKNKGLTLWDQMIKMYEKYGFYKEGLYTITLEGAEGSEKIKEILNNMRKNPITKVGDFEVLKFRDYESGIIKELSTSKEERTNLPKSNVLYYELSDNAWCCVRPSGTEPKIKFYMGVKGSNLQDADNKLQEITEEMKKYSKC